MGVYGCMVRAKRGVSIVFPAYQLDDGGYGTSAAPIYQLFVEKALDLDPRYAVFVTPSRWMAGGKGLDKYRERMLSDKRMRNTVDYPKLYEGFPGVKIRGGISYFLWDRDHNGPCMVQTIWNGQPTGPAGGRPPPHLATLFPRHEGPTPFGGGTAPGGATPYHPRFSPQNVLVPPLLPRH